MPVKNLGCMNAELYFKRSTVPFKDFQEDGVLLDPTTGEFYLLDSVCHFIWSRLDGDRSLGQMAHEISQEYEVSQSRALADLMEFVEQLHAHGLVDRLDAKTNPES